MLICCRLCSIALVTLAIGCLKPAPPPVVATPATPAAPVTTVVTEAPIARLLGQPVLRGDCLSPSSGIGSVEVGFHNLVLGVLTNDFCKDMQRPKLDEVDSFVKELTEGLLGSSQTQLDLLELQLAAEDLPADKRQALEKQKEQLAAKLAEGVPPSPAFNEPQVQAKLAEIRGKLATPQLPWLERLGLEGQERAQLFALEQKSSLAPVIYAELMPLHCKAELYKKYGGKVVARQISMEPAEAYLKLVQEAEAAKRLELLDDGIRDAFWQRMQNDLNHPVVPPENIDFTLPAILQSRGR